MGARKICVVTGSRADYGPMRWLLKELVSDSRFQLSILATGKHFDQGHGSTIQEIREDGFEVAATVPFENSDDGPMAILEAMGKALPRLAQSLTTIRPDILVMLGDRYEILVVAQAALLLKIPVAHLHGGEKSVGAIDDSIRHAITKLSHLHFVAAEPYRRRVIQLGENASNVHCVGTFGLESLLRAEMKSRSALESALKFTFGNPTFLVCYHPMTLSNDSEEKSAGEIVQALEQFPQAKVILTGANADAGSNAIYRRFQGFAKTNSQRAIFIPSLGHENYLSTLKQCDLLIGNSSSGILEAPAVGTVTINAGGRQQGRLRADSIIDCEVAEKSITSAIRKALTPEFQAQVEKMVEGKTFPYLPALASQKTKEVLAEVDLKAILLKDFVDLKGGGKP